MKTIKIQDKSVASKYVKTEALSYGVMITFLDDDNDLCGHCVEFQDVVTIDGGAYRVLSATQDNVVMLAMSTDTTCKISMTNFATYIDKF